MLQARHCGLFPSARLGSAWWPWPHSHAPLPASFVSFLELSCCHFINWRVDLCTDCRVGFNCKMSNHGKGTNIGVHHGAGLGCGSRLYSPLGAWRVTPHLYNGRATILISVSHLPVFFIQVWGETQELASLTCSQEVTPQPVWGPHFENHRLEDICGVPAHRKVSNNDDYYFVALHCTRYHIHLPGTWQVPKHVSEETMETTPSAPLGGQTPR